MGERGRDLYADGWDDGFARGWDAAVEHLLDLAALERAVARRLHMQEAAQLLHGNRPQIVRAAR